MSSEHVDLTQAEVEALREGFSGDITEADWLTLVRMTSKGLVIPQDDCPAVFVLTELGRAVVERLGAE